MQNERSGSNSRRRDAAAQRRLQLQEASSNNEEEPEAGVPHLRTGSVRSHSVGPRRQSLRGSYSGHGRAEPPGSEEPAGPSNSQPPALEYYRPSDEECEDIDMADADEIMAEDESDVPAEKSTAELTDISDSEDEIIDEQDEEEGDVDDSALQQQQQDGSSGRRKSSSSCKSKPAASGAAIHGQASTLLGSSSKRRSQKHQQQHQRQSSASASASVSTSSSRHHQQQSRKRSSKHADLEQQQPAEEEEEQEKEQLEEFDCSSEQYAVDIKRLRESKLKHNKNEQMRRKDMKEAVHRLRNQLRRKTKKPSTISVLKAAKQEIDELTAIKVEEEKELERLRKRELFLKYQLESLVSDRNQRLSTGGSAGVLVSPVCPGVVGPTASFLPPTAAPGATNPPPPLPPTPPQPLPPSINPRPPHAQYPSLFSAVLPPPPPAIPYSGTAAASSPTAIGRLGVIPDRPQQHVAAHASSAGLSPIHPRLPIPLPQPPTLIPAAAIAAHFSNPSTPPSAGGGGGGGGVGGRGLSAPPTAAATPGAATISIFPAPPPGSTAVIPGGLAPLHLLQPRTTTNTVAAAQQLYTGFPSAPIIMSYPGIAAAVGRHPSPTTPIVGPPGLTASPHHHPAIGRLTMAPTFPFYLPTALRPPTMPAATGLGAAHYSPAATAASTSVSQPGSTRRVQLLASAGPPSSSDHSMARRSSGDDGGGDRSVRSTDADSDRHRHRSSTGTGSKNGVVSAETYIPSGPHTQSPSSKAVGNAPSVREVSAESRRVARSLDDNGVCVITVVDSRESDEYRLRPAKRSRNNDSNIDDDDDSYLRSGPTMEKRQRLFNRYNRNGVVSVEKNVSKKHLLSAAPPLLKMIDSAEADHGASDEKWSEDRQQFVRERRADRNRYHHHHQCTLPPPPALRNAEVISTVIKHIQPRRETVSSSMVTGVGYGDHEKEFELRNGVEEPRYRGGGGGGGEQRYRVSNSLSSSDECPDSPLSQQNFTNQSAEQSMCSCNKKIGRDGVYVQVASHCKHSSSSTEVSHRGNSQHRSSRKKKSNSYLHRPNHGYHSIAVLQTTT